MKKILITGASGFIGSYLVEEALNRNFEVYAAIRKTSNRDYLTDKRIHFVELDYGSKESLEKELRIVKYDYIFHNSGLTQSKREKDYFRVNFEYTRNLIEALIQTSSVPEKFIFTSSLASFGPGDDNNIGPVKLTGVPNPITTYGKSKLEAEKYILSLSGFPYIILRPTAVFGPRERNLYLVFKTINNHLETYMGFKKQHLTFIFVRDLVNVFFLALESGQINKAYFVADGNDYSSEMLNQYIKNQLNKKTIKIHFPVSVLKPLAFINEKITGLLGRMSIFNLEKVNELASSNWLCEVQPTFEELQFKPRYDLESGIAETVKWYKENKWL